MKNYNISKQSFLDLKGLGHCVPRWEKSGEVIPMTAGKEFMINNLVVVKVTQSHPTHIVLS